ncbi:hypothetical protein ACQ4PT_040790 [Festuca glaucescens]
MRFREFKEDPPEYVLYPSEESNLFTLEVVHNGFFRGLRDNLEYVVSSVDHFDYLTGDIWSMDWMNEILTSLGLARDGKLHLYWCLPDKDIREGLVPLDCDAVIRIMARASLKEKTLCVFVDHTDFLRQLRTDVVQSNAPVANSPSAVARPPPAAAPSIASSKMAAAVSRAVQAISSGSSKLPNAGASPLPEASCSSFVEEGVSGNLRDSDSDSDFEFYDSDYDVEDGDDDLFADNVDKSVGDNNEKEMVDDKEDEDALDDETLQLGEENMVVLRNKLTEFNPTCDMHNPIFVRGMTFSGVEELRKALATYAVRNRKKIKKVLNDRRSYILEAREMAFLSMLETIFYEILQRQEIKQREWMTWTGRICPKIKKKLEKFFEWSNNCIVKPAGNYLFAVESHEFEKHYSVDFKSRTCDCKRWQLTGIPCHHAISCCRKDNINYENLVHSCYTVETYKRAYAYTLAPLRGRVFWEKMNATRVHPPLYTKVMGRPKRCRRKAPEEKVKKGVTYFTKARTIIHCSICGKSGHNKKGHQTYLLSQQQQMEEGVIWEDGEIDIPSILEHIYPQTANPDLDPTNIQESMVYRMQQEQNEHMPANTVLGPLPENEFIASARDSMPQSTTRVTTASTRGNLRARGRGRATGGREATAAGTRGRGKRNATGHGTVDATTSGGRKTRKTNATVGNADAKTTRGHSCIPDLNDAIPELNAHEWPLSQNAPQADDA